MTRYQLPIDIQNFQTEQNFHYMDKTSRSQRLWATGIIISYTRQVESARAFINNFVLFIELVHQSEQAILGEFLQP